LGGGLVQLRGGFRAGRCISRVGDHVVQ
jgi:hypothetical protein